MKNVIIFGGSGLVGYSLVRQFKEKGWRVTSITQKTDVPEADKNFHLDLTSIGSFDNLPSIGEYDLVINSLAITDVKLNETRFNDAYVLHIALSRHLANRANKYIYISSVAVYGELSTSNPNGKISLPNWYSKTKFFGEPNSNHLSLRINVIGLESLTKRSLLEWAFKSLVANEYITGFDNQFINPVLPIHVYRVCLEYFEEKVKPGIYDVGSNELVSKYSILQTLAQMLGKEDYLRRGRSGNGDRYQITNNENLISVNLELKDYVSRYLGEITTA